MRCLLPLVILIVAFAVSGCGDSVAPAAQPIATATPADPYAALTPRQVAETFMTAYQNEQYNICTALFAPSVRAGFPSPDSFALEQHATTVQQGTVTQWTILSTVDQGARIIYEAEVHRSHDPTLFADWEVKVERVDSTWKVTLFG